MKKLLLFLILIFCQTTPFASNPWPYSEIRAVGKNLTSMASFYSQCGSKKLITTNPTVSRWIGFMGMKYLIIGGVESEQRKWLENGSKGILINDPTKSEDSLKVPFSKETCENVREILEFQFKTGHDYIFGKDN